jgi:hypothetical protein
MKTRGTALEWLVHPVTLVALVVLLVNDHVLKDRYPGPVTGKLSDVAGLIVFPPVLALGLAWLRVPAAAPIAVAVTGIGFASVKLVPVLADVAGVQADPTDLLALPALGVALWLSSTVDGEVRWRRFAVYVALPIAVFGIAATSAPFYSKGAQALVSWHGMVLLGEDRQRYGDQPYAWTASTDGLTWRPLTDDETAQLQADLPELNPRSDGGCEPGDPGHCFRIAAGRLRVDETTDAGATWRRAWEVPEWQRRLLADDLGHPAEDVTSQALLVQPVPDGYAVLVADGADGLARRDAAGQWARIGSNGVVQPLRSVPVRGGSSDVAFAFALAAVALLVASVNASPDSAGQAGVGIVIVVVTVLATALYHLMTIHSQYDEPATVWVGAVLAWCGALLVFAVSLPFRNWAAVIGLGFLQAAVWVAARSAAEVGWIPSAAGVPLALAGVLVVWALAAAVGARIARRKATDEAASDNAEHLATS